MDKDAQWFLSRLNDSSSSDADIESCVETLEMLLSQDALVPLVALLSNATRSLEVRKRAALAIREIGMDPVRQELLRLLNAESNEIRTLAKMAIG